MVYGPFISFVNARRDKRIRLLAFYEDIFSPTAKKMRKGHITLSLSYARESIHFSPSSCMVYFFSPPEEEGKSSSPPHLYSE
jgi:hypothetical protein